MVVVVAGKLLKLLMRQACIEAPLMTDVSKIVAHAETSHLPDLCTSSWAGTSPTPTFLVNIKL
jgi:hypothetical protein